MKYPSTSPYFITNIVNNAYLDVMTNRAIPKDPQDVYWQIGATYHQRPDLLAYDLYDDPKLWWVFAQRNPNKLVDPLFDFVQGTYIYLPKAETLKAVLGL
jgi:hypothetical protein